MIRRAIRRGASTSIASDSSLANTQLLRLLEREQVWVREQLLELEDDLHELEWRGLIRSARLRAESGELQLELLGARRWLIPPRDWADLGARLRAERLNWPSPGEPLRGQAPEQVFAAWTESWTEAARLSPARSHPTRRRSVALTLPPTNDDLCALILGSLWQQLQALEGRAQSAQLSSRVGGSIVATAGATGAAAMLSAVSVGTDLALFTVHPALTAALGAGGLMLGAASGWTMLRWTASPEREFTAELPSGRQATLQRSALQRPSAATAGQARSSLTGASERTASSAASEIASEAASSAQPPSARRLQQLVRRAEALSSAPAGSALEESALEFGLRG